MGGSPKRERTRIGGLLGLSTALKIFRQFPVGHPPRRDARRLSDRVAGTGALSVCQGFGGGWPVSTSARQARALSPLPTICALHALLSSIYKRMVGRSSREYLTWRHHYGHGDHDLKLPNTTCKTM